MLTNSSGPRQQADAEIAATPPATSTLLPTLWSAARWIDAFLPDTLSVRRWSFSFVCTQRKTILIL
jgi:hypothetical protein